MSEATKQAAWWKESDTSPSGEFRLINTTYGFGDKVKRIKWNTKIAIEKALARGDYKEARRLFEQSPGSENMNQSIHITTIGLN